LGDSTLIISKLEDDGLLDDLNSKLSPVEKANDLALRALLEDKLYFYQVSNSLIFQATKADIFRNTRDGM
jgi:hypothetical protein